MGAFKLLSIIVYSYKKAGVQRGEVMKKILTFAEAAALVPDGAVLSTCGIGAIGHSMKFDFAIEERFQKEGHPKGLTLFHAAGQSGYELHLGLNCYAHEGLLSRLIGGHIDTAREIVRLSLEKGAPKIYNLPQGQIARLFRAIAAKEPGVLTKVGIGTFVDPRVEGPGLTQGASNGLVEVVTLNEEEYLFYKTIPVDVAVIRATVADTKGNLTANWEPAVTDMLALAMAAHNSGGFVVAEVQRLTEFGTLDPRRVIVPGALVDYVVVDEEQRMTPFEAYNPSYVGDSRHPEPWVLAARIKEMSAGITPQRGLIDMVIIRRAAFELQKGAVVNVGLGIPEGVAEVAASEGIFEEMTFTVESGPFGGIPCAGVSFGAAINPEAILPSASMFDFYNGGGLDLAFMGFAEVDGEGNVNASKVKGRLIGAGGFIDITQRAKKVVFVGKFSDKAEYEGSTEGLKKVKEGKPKFAGRVSQLTFSADFARSIGQKVLYVTERAVFELCEKGLELVEVPLGIDIERDIFSVLPFRVSVASPLRTMDARIFGQGTLGLKGDSFR